MEHVELQGVSIVLIGSFNPAIFNPDWLVSQGIISAEEAQDANVEIIHPEIAQFSVGDLLFDVNSERFTLHAVAEPFVKGADVIADLFANRLKHTPTTALGINYLAHFRVRDWHMQNALGRMLAPVEPWGEWGEAVKGKGDIETNGGLMSITMQEQSPADRKAGSVKVTVQPSNRLKPAGSGVFVQVNDQYESVADEGESFAELCARMITPSLERSRRIVSGLSDRAWSL